MRSNSCLQGKVTFVRDHKGICFGLMVHGRVVFCKVETDILPPSTNMLVRVHGSWSAVPNGGFNVNRFELITVDSSAAWPGALRA